MPISKRNSLGRFEKTENIKFEGGFTFPMPTGWSSKIILIVGLIFLVSPWIFMVAKRDERSRFPRACEAEAGPRGRRK